MAAHEHASAMLAVSTVIFALRSDEETGGEPQVWLPLVRRIRDPYEGCWALPGGPLRVGEDLAYAAARTLGDTTGLTPRYLEQLYTFGDAVRSPDAADSVERVVSIVYWALVGSAEAEQATAGENVGWFAADDLPRLAFDHNVIVEYACARRWSTPASPTPSSASASRSRSCAKCTRPCSAGRSTRRTSGGRSRPPAPWSRPATT